MPAFSYHAVDTSIRCELDDIRGSYPELHHPNPDSYPMSAAFARRLRNANSNGIACRSVRHEDGECAAVIRLEAVPLQSSLPAGGADW
jgi:hypothetical protein